MDRLNQWLTLAANVGVLLGIIFVAVEVRQNTAATLSGTLQSLTDNSTEGLRSYAANAELARIRIKRGF